ncbi:hypothetical protein VNO77_34723 [Canavalia gladiata]|uniref:Pectinesterase inhibitor domain-containing protein n=1 Tax=Canavalia gladiata TaxID=3824 RepID=A0AAN9KH37_CANGL
MFCKVCVLVMAFLLFVASSFAITADEVNAICRQTKDSSFCSALLDSKPNADLVTLAQYTIDVARVNVTNTIKVINSLISNSSGDPKSKSHYESCLLHFGPEGAINHVDQTQELLKKGDYGGVNVAASAIQTDVDDCISGESPSDPPYPDHSILPKYAATVDLVVQIILVISNRLVH